jgi:hypothetical protein
VQSRILRAVVTRTYLFLFYRPTLFSFAKHYETGQPLPEALFEKVRFVSKPWL